MQEYQKPRAIALGYFDGVHLGHQALMERAVERAKQIGGTSAVFTFDAIRISILTYIRIRSCWAAGAAADGPTLTAVRRSKAWRRG